MGLKLLSLCGYFVNNGDNILLNETCELLVDDNLLEEL